MTILLAAAYLLGVATTLLVQNIREMRDTPDLESAAGDPRANQPPSRTPEGPRPSMPVAIVHRDYRADITEAQRRDRWRSKGTP